MNQETSLKLSDKVLFKGLKWANYNSGSTTRQYPGCSKEKEEVGSFYGKKDILEKNQSCLLSLVWASDLPDVWWSGHVTILSPKSFRGSPTYLQPLMHNWNVLKYIPRLKKNKIVSLMFQPPWLSSAWLSWLQFVSSLLPHPCPAPQRGPALIPLATA